MKRAAAAAVACVVASLAILAFVRAGSSEPSLGAPRTTSTAPVTTGGDPEQGPRTTVPDIGALDLDAATALGDPCALLTDELRSAFAAGAPHEHGAGECRSDAPSGRLAVRVVEQPEGAQWASQDFQERYGEGAVEPLDVGRFGLAYVVVQGRTALVAVFANGVSVTFDLPAGEVGAAHLDLVDAALDPIRHA